MRSLAMPEKKSAKKGSEFTSTRLYTEDQVKLSELAALRRESLADTFRTLFGKLLDSALIEAAERRATQIRNERK